MPIRNASADVAIDVGKALELRWRGMSFEDIGKVFGVTKQSVTTRLSRWKAIVADPSYPSIFDNHALSLLKTVHMQCLVALQRKLDHPKSTVNNLAFANKQLFEQIRLLEGKSTSNVSTLTKVILEAHKAQDLAQLEGDLSTDLPSTGTLPLTEKDMGLERKLKRIETSLNAIPNVVSKRKPGKRKRRVKRSVVSDVVSDPIVLDVELGQDEG